MEEHEVLVLKCVVLWRRPGPPLGVPVGGDDDLVGVDPPGDGDEAPEALHADGPSPATEPATQTDHDSEEEVLEPLRKIARGEMDSESDSEGCLEVLRSIAEDRYC